MAACNIFQGSLACHTQYYFAIEERGLVLLALELTSNLPNSFSTSFNLQLNNESGTISKVRYQRWRLNALIALFETELSTA